MFRKRGMRKGGRAVTCGTNNDCAVGTSFSCIPRVTGSRLCLSFGVAGKGGSCAVPSIGVTSNIVTASRLPATTDSGTSCTGSTFRHVVGSTRATGVVFLVRRTGLHGDRLGSSSVGRFRGGITRIGTSAGGCGLGGVRVSTCTSPSNNIGLGANLTRGHRTGARGCVRHRLGGNGVSAGLSTGCATRS